jgi:uncharacterized membrane protein
MFILSILPDWVFHAITIVGILGTVVGFVLGMIPVVKTYIIPIRVISILLLCLGLYLEGGLADNKVWEAKVKEVEAKLAVAEIKSAKENIKIVTKVITKTQVVKTRGEDIVRYVDREIVKYDEKFAKGGVCEIPKEFIKAHNDSAEQPK